MEFAVRAERHVSGGRAQRLAAKGSHTVSKKVKWIVQPLRWEELNHSPLSKHANGKSCPNWFCPLRTISAC